MDVLTGFTLVIFASIVFGQDPCTNYISLNDPHRSTAFIPKTTDRLICDENRTPGWYKLGNNEDMPTSCVPQYHCGTNSPIWLSGKLPNVGEGEVSRTACINYGFTGTCCEDTLNIKVKNCGTYNVYWLRNAPGCNIAYCIGSKPVCEIGGYRYNATDCGSLYPKMTKSPELGMPEPYQGTVHFPCKINYPLGEPNVSFTVQWDVDGEPVTDIRTHAPIKTTLVGDQRTAYLDARNLMLKMNKNLHCTVTSHFTKSPGVTSDKLQSNGYWCGIKVSKTSLTVDEQHPEQEVDLISTLPVPGCDPITHQDCELEVQLKVSNGSQDVSLQKCKYTLKYDPITKTWRTTVKVKATRDFIDDHDRNHKLKFEIVKNTNQAWWFHYQVPDVQLHTIDKAHGTCQEVTDPHGTTLDKRPIGTYELGEFLMYRSKTRDFEVHIKTGVCGEHWKPCVCAVVAKEGNDIVKVDMCERRRNQLANPELVSLSQHPLEATTSRYETDTSGKHFYLTFASGSRLKIDALKHTPNAGYLNVNLQVPGDDLKNTEGLCGLWNSNPKDDLTGPNGESYNNDKDFSHSWRFKNHSSLFHQPPPYDPVKAKQAHYCKCGDNNVADCTKGKGANNPLNGKCNGGKCIPLKPKKHARSLNDIDLKDLQESKISYRNVIKRTATWPTASGITQDGARSMCVKALKEASLFHYCGENNPHLPLDVYVSACIEDVLFSDGDYFMLGHMNAIDNACQDIVIRNISNYNTDHNGDLELKSEFKTVLENCPNNCNRQGKCITGKCVCNPGYISVDCSIPVGVAPVVDHITGDGLCDIRKSPCTTANIVANHLWYSPHLQCRYRKAINSHGRFVPHGGYSVSHAAFVSFLEVECALPASTVGHGHATDAFFVSVTTDGQRWSSEKMFLVFDSECQQCDIYGICHTKNHTCFINGQCHQQGEQNQDHTICDPKLSQTSWSNVAPVKEIDHFTATYTGCPCPENRQLHTCACCQNNGCQCGKRQPNQCVDCREMESCGQYPELFPVQK